MKTCSKCRSEKPATMEFFSREAKARDGLKPHCKACGCRATRGWCVANPMKKRAADRRYYRLNRARILTQSRNYYATNRARINAANRRWYRENVERAAVIARAWRTRNPERAAELSRLKRAADPGRYREHSRAWLKTHPKTKAVREARRRARRHAADGSFVEADVRRVYEQQSGRCFYCQADLGEVFHIDHMMPLARGGSNAAENICCACPRCNVRKWALTAEEYRARLATMTRAAA